MSDVTCVALSNLWGPELAGTDGLQATGSEVSDSPFFRAGRIRRNPRWRHQSGSEMVGSVRTEIARSVRIRAAGFNWSRGRIPGVSQMWPDVSGAAVGRVRRDPRGRIRRDSEGAGSASSDVAGSTGSEVAGSVGSEVAGSAGFEVAGSTGSEVAGSAGFEVAGSTGSEVAGSTGSEVAGSTGAEVTDLQDPRWPDLQDPRWPDLQAPR